MPADPIVSDTDTLTAYQGGDADLLLEQATAVVRDYCGWHVAPSYTETITVDGAVPRVFLPSLHVTAVTSVTLGGVTLDPGTYQWSASGILWSSSYAGFLSGDLPYRNLTVTFTHGYNSVPALAGVIMARASRVQDNGKSLTRTQAGPFSDTYEAGNGFTDEERAVLARYRLPVLR